MEYELVDRLTVRELYDGTTEEVTVQDAVVKVDCGFEAFRKWYWEYRVFERVVVLEPKGWNDRLLATFVERFANRLTKYGRTHNYHLTSELKPEYVEEMRQREADYERWAAERREHLKAEKERKAAEDKPAQ